MKSFKSSSFDYSQDHMVTYLSCLEIYITKYQQNDQCFYIIIDIVIIFNFFIFEFFKSKIVN